MRVREGALTPKEQVFVQHYATSGDATYAAEKAGYASRDSAAHLVPAKPRIATAVEAIRERLRTEGAEIGVKTLIDLARDDKIPPGIRRAAASDLVKYSGVSGLDESTRKDLADMTLEEIEKRRQELMRINSDNAKVIEVEPASIAQSAPNPISETSLFD
jgi:hypothetical protein